MPKKSILEVSNNLPVAAYKVVGSVSTLLRKAGDIDIICYKADIKVEHNSATDFFVGFKFEGYTVECLLADNSPVLQQLLALPYPPFVINYILKYGHLYHPIKGQGNWKKHLHDYLTVKELVDVFCMQNYSQREDIELLAISYRKEMNELRKLRTPKLKGTTKEEFFDDAVKKYYVHDNIHKAMAHKEHPMYTYMQPDPNLVHCSKELWDQFTHQEKIWCVMEEAYVIALERKIIPAMVAGRSYEPVTKHFAWALYRICTTLCSGWFRKFAVDNYYEIISSIDVDYVNTFLNNIRKYEDKSIAELATN